MLYGDAFKTLKRDKLVVTCLVVIAVFVVLALMSFIKPWFPLDPEKGPDDVTLIERSYHPPTPLIALGYVSEADGKTLTDEQKAAFDGGLSSAAAWRYPLGADLSGRGVFGMCLHGLWWAFIIGAVTTIISIVIAVPIGAVAGYFGGIVDDVVVWVYTTLASIPQLLLLIALIASLRDEMDSEYRVWIVLLVIGLTTWIGLARLIRAEFLKHKQRDYVVAARALGFGHDRIIFSHILPNVLHLVIITFTLGFIGGVNLEVFLSFIGVGIPPETPTLGQMIAKAKEELTRQPSVWWPLASATGFLFILSLAFSIFGDALRDALDPKLRT